MKFKWGDYTAVEAPPPPRLPTTSKPHPNAFVPAHSFCLVALLLAPLPSMEPLASLARLYSSLSLFSLPAFTSVSVSLLSDSQLLSLSLCLSSSLSLSLARPLQLGIHVSGAADRQLMYCEAKMAARPYQTVKQQWFRSLQETGLGTWVKKPPEQEQFLLSV